MRSVSGSVVSFTKAWSTFFGSFLPALDSQPYCAPTFDRAEYHSFVIEIPASYVTLLAANVGFVNFHDPLQPRSIGFFYSLADTMAKIPRGLIAYFQSALQLVGGHTLFGFRHQVGYEKPPPERQMRVMEDSTRCDAKLIVAEVAIVLEPIMNFCGFAEAAWADRTFRPTEMLQARPAAVIGTKLFNQFDEVNTFWD